jgi:carbon-monoxide dehydrogenase medium subunit
MNGQGDGILKAADFDYIRPDTLEEALVTLATHDGEARPIAGGQSLMPMMNFRLSQPDLLVDLNALEDLKGIEEKNDSILVGAMTRYSELDRSAVVAQHLPLVKMALPHIAHAAIRNRGTIGGSVSLADPAAEMPALMLALDAVIIAVSSTGERRIAADEFFLGLYETALREDEIVKAVSIPKAPPGARFAFREIARRHGDYAMAGVAIAARESDPFDGMRIAFFSVSDRAIRALAAEDALNGRVGGDSDAVAAALATVDALELQGDLNASIATKTHLARVMLKRALREL